MRYRQAKDKSDIRGKSLDVVNARRHGRAKEEENMNTKKTKGEKMTKTEILSNIRVNGGFCNLGGWGRKEIKTWIKANYNCSDYTADIVSFNLI
jgi:hypothetical protein